MPAGSPHSDRKRVVLFEPDHLVPGIVPLGLQAVVLIALLLGNEAIDLILEVAVFRVVFLVGVVEEFLREFSHAGLSSCTALAVRSSAVSAPGRFILSS